MRTTPRSKIERVAFSDVTRHRHVVSAQDRLNDELDTLSWERKIVQARPNYSTHHVQKPFRCPPLRVTMLVSSRPSGYCSHCSWEAGFLRSVASSWELHAGNTRSEIPDASIATSPKCRRLLIVHRPTDTTVRPKYQPLRLRRDSIGLGWTHNTADCDTYAGIVDATG